MKVRLWGHANHWFTVALMVLLAAASALSGQHKSKAKKDKNAGPVAPEVRLPDSDEIEKEISEMLGYWQVGDADIMHKYYADDVTVVSGAYEPPLVGWANYLAAYQRQRARLGPVRLDRRNTFINVKGNIAWAAYQWDFNATVDGRPTSARGQTTLILERRGDRWVILHNHTSEICEPQTPEPVAPPAQARPKPGN